MRTSGFPASSSPIYSMHQLYSVVQEAFRFGSFSHSVNLLASQ
jgi:hypothetical protein